MQELNGLPSAIEAERAVLGICLLNNDCIDEIPEVLTPNEFFLTSSQIICRAMLEIRRQGDPVDEVTLGEYLRGRGEFEKVGGMTHIASLIDGVPRDDTISYYAKIVRRKARVRNLMKACSQIVSACHEDPDDPDLFANAQREFWSATEEAQTSGFVPVHEVAWGYLQEIERISSREGAIAGIPTGISEFDYKTLGLQRRELAILAGRPSAGKTSLSFQIALNVAEQGLGVGYFSLEMSAERLAEKAISNWARLDSFKMRAGQMSEREGWAKASDAIHKMSPPMRLHICDEASMGMPEIRAKAQRLRREQGLDVMLLDFLQLIEADPAAKTEFEAVSKNVKQLRALAKEMDIAILALAQLNRFVEHRQDPRPKLSDLEGSGKIEQVADVITFIYRDCEDPKDQIANVYMAKNRNGSQGEFKLMYLKEFNRFERVRA